MKEIITTVYESEDGTRFSDRTRAQINDAFISGTALILHALDWPRPDGFSSSPDWWQHDPSTVREVKTLLLKLTRTVLRADMAEHEAKGTNFMTVHPSWIIRLLDSAHPPLERAWQRLACILPDGREAGQQYYAAYPKEMLTGRALN